MKVIGSRPRKVHLKSGTVITLIIRRLYCPNCHRIHHELPDCITPYKRYGTLAIEAVLKATRNNPEGNDFPGENSTMARLKTWFSLLRNYMEAALKSIKALYPDDQGLAEEVDGLIPLDPLHSPPGWLGRLVRMLVNSNRWVQTRSALTVRS